ncbi:MAG: glycosyltransferase family 39 protein [Bacteroidia bacterium]|nr:glycosyltransferase family 39 protein [Bacteroidia bacterium]
MIDWLRRLWGQPERLFVLIAVLQFPIRVALQFIARLPINGFEDLDIALHLVRGEGFSIGERGPTTAKGPIYPFFLALFLWLGGDPSYLWQPVIVQHLLLSWMPFIMYRLGSHIASPTIGKLAGLLFALHPSFLYYPTVLENTVLFIFFTALWGIGVYRLREKLSWGWLAFVGVWWGLMWIEKPMAFLPMAIGLIWVLPQRLLWRTVLVGFLPIFAWALRGYSTFGYFTWTKTYAGQHTFAVSWCFGIAVSPDYVVSDSLACAMDSLLRLPESVSGPAFEKLSREILTQQGLPKLVRRTLLQAAIFWWIVPRYWNDQSLKFWVVRKLPVILINTLFLIGTLYGLRFYPRLTLYVLMSSLVFTLFYALNQVANTRYRLDVEWLQLYVCAIAIEGVLRLRGDELPKET